MIRIVHNPSNYVHVGFRVVTQIMHRTSSERATHYCGSSYQDSCLSCFLELQGAGVATASLSRRSAPVLDSLPAPAVHRAVEAASPVRQLRQLTLSRMVTAYNVFIVFTDMRIYQYSRACADATHIVTLAKNWILKESSAEPDILIDVITTSSGHAIEFLGSCAIPRTRVLSRLRTAIGNNNP